MTTSADLPQPGVYVFRLAANDGEWPAADELAMTVRPALASHYLEFKFEEGNGQMARDSSANHLDALLGSGVNVETNDPAWTAGWRGGGLQFDGTNDYVRLISRL